MLYRLVIFWKLSGTSDHCGNERIKNMKLFSQKRVLIEGENKGGSDYLRRNFELLNPL